jgi:hypothetical protein
MTALIICTLPALRIELVDTPADFTGQVRRVAAPIRRKLRRRAAVEPMIGRIEAEHSLGRDYLKDASATVLALSDLTFPGWRRFLYALTPILRQTSRWHRRGNPGSVSSRGEVYR